MLEYGLWKDGCWSTRWKKKELTRSFWKILGIDKYLHRIKVYTCTRCNAYLVLLIDENKIVIYKSTYRIKRKYFIMLMKLERSSSQRIIALHDLQSTFAYIINKILLIYLLLLRNNIPKKLEPRKLLHP